MRIILRNESQKERRLYIPNALLVNRLTSALISKGLEKHGIHLQCEHIRELAENIKAVRKCYPDWVLMEAEDAKGEKIKIIL